MSDDNAPEKKPKRSLVETVVGMVREGGPERTRLVVWVVLAGFGIYLIATGVVGILTKAR